MSCLRILMKWQSRFWAGQTNEKSLAERDIVGKLAGDVTRTPCPGTRATDYEIWDIRGVDDD